MDGGCVEVGEDEIILFWRFTHSLCSTEHLCMVGGGFGTTEPHEAFLNTPCSCKEGKEDRFPW